MDGTWVGCGGIDGGSWEVARDGGSVTPGRSAEARTAGTSVDERISGVGASSLRPRTTIALGLHDASWV